MENKHKKLAYYLLLIFFIIALISTGFVYARYSYETGDEGLVHSNEFYFACDFLDGQTHILAPGSTEITFTLENHADELRYSQVDIDYIVKVDGNIPSGEHIEGTLNLGSIQEQKVKVTGLEPGHTYVITALGEGGYHKTLSATVIIPPRDAALYKYLDVSNPEYVLLTVWAKGVQGNIVINPPNIVIPDNTDEVMRNTKKGETITDTSSFDANSHGYGSHVYRFFGSDVTIDDFTITCGLITAETKEPN